MKTIDRFMFIAINQKNCGLYTAITFLRYAIAGIAINQLAEQEKIFIENNKLSVKDTSATGDALLDEILQVLAKKDKPQRLDSSIFSISYKVGRLDRRVLESLEDNGWLRIDQERFLGLFPYKRYVITNETEKENIINSYKETLLNGIKSIDRESMLIISMATVSGFMGKLFLREEKGRIYNALKQIKKGTYFEPKDEIMSDVIAAVKRTIAATQSAAGA
jgi:hypothetical protein